MSSDSIARRFAGKYSMVTGASTGIGRAIALRLASQGADLVVHCRNDGAPIQKLIATVQELGQQCVPVFGDFSDSDFSHQNFVDQAMACFGHIDHWINNAGGDVLTGDLADANLDEKMNYLWQVDVISTFKFSRVFADHIGNEPETQAGRHSIVNVGWDQAFQGMAGDAGQMFSTSKGAIMAMSLSMAQSFAPNVRVNCVAPGWIQTDWGKQTSEYWDHRAKSESLMHRWGKPDDVADAVSYCCSSSFVSGQILSVNGGFRFSQGF